MYGFVDDIGWWQDWMVVLLIAFAVGFYWCVDWLGSRSDRPIAADWARAAEALKRNLPQQAAGIV